MKLVVAFRNFCECTYKGNTSNFICCIVTAQFLVFHLLSRVLYVESVSSHTWFIFLEANTSIFAADFFPADVPPFHKVQETNVCRRDAVSPHY